MNKLQRIAGYFHFLVGIAYVVLGLFLFINPQSLDHLIRENLYCQLLGAILAIYGVFRIFRAYKHQLNK